METNNLHVGFEQLRNQQKKNIVIAVFNLNRYAKMSKKDLLNEVGGETKLSIPELRSYLKTKEVNDLQLAQTNIRLLNKLEKTYGNKNATSNLIEDLQRDFGISPDK